MIEPSLHIDTDNEGALLITGFFGDVRFGISLECDTVESGFYLVAKRGAFPSDDMVAEYGGIMPEAIETLAHWIIKNWGPVLHPLIDWPQAVGVVEKERGE